MRHLHFVTRACNLPAAAQNVREPTPKEALGCLIATLLKIDDSCLDVQP